MSDEQVQGDSVAKDNDAKEAPKADAPPAEAKADAPEPKPKAPKPKAPKPKAPKPKAPKPKAPESDAPKSEPDGPKSDVRKDSNVVVVDASLLGEEKTDGDEPAQKRKVRRSRTVDAAPPPEPASDDEAPKKKRRRRRKNEDGGDGKGGSAVLQTQSRRVYRQDVPDGSEDPGKAAPRRGRRPEEPAKKDVNKLDKITLLLHPAPKAGGKVKQKKKDRPKTAKEALRAKTKAPKKERQAAKGGPVEIDPAWVKVDMAGAADAIGNAGDAGEALVKAWLEASNVGPIAVVAQLERGASGKARKAARRALNVLKSRGVEIPIIEQAVAQQKTGPEPYVAKYIPPDASGTTFLSISQRQKGGRYHVADVLFRSNVGVVHATTARLAGKHIKGWQKRIESQFGAKPVEVPLEWARHQIAEARKKNDESKQIVPMGFDNCAAMIEPVPETAPAHPLADLESGEPSKDDVEKATLGSDALHADPEFRTWMPDRGALDELLRKVGERVGSEESAQDPKVVDEALKVELTAATDRFFSPELRTELAERMRGAAISVRARSGDDAAKRVLCIAKAVKEAGLITSPPSEIPFLMTFFQKAVAMMVRQGQGQLRVPIPNEERANP